MKHGSGTNTNVYVLVGRSMQMAKGDNSENFDQVRCHNNGKYIQIVIQLFIGAAGVKAVVFSLKH